MRPVKNDSRRYTLLLVGDAGSGPCRRLTTSWADAEQAADFGAANAHKHFAGVVEVIVIETMTRRAVLSRLVRLNEGEGEQGEGETTDG